MDERSLAWVHLLEPESKLRVLGMPKAAGPLLGDRLGETGDTLVAWGADAEQLPALTGLSAVVLVNPGSARRAAAQLLQKGFSHTRSFVEVPDLDLRGVRLLAPTRPRRASARVWDMFESWGAARAVVAAGRTISWAGGASFLGNRVLIAQRRPAALERAVTAAIGCSTPLSLGLRPHWSGPHFRIVLQVMTSDGALVQAYAKYGLGVHARAAVEREARLTECAAGLTLRSVRVDPPLAHGPLGAGYLMVCAPVDGTSEGSLSSLTAAHMAVLSELASVSGGARGDVLAHRLGDRVALLVADSGPVWRCLLQRAVTALTASPGLARVPSAFAHGDFTPWNMRLVPGTARLALFDWEWAEPEQFLLWDSFHFEVQTSIELRGAPPHRAIRAALDSALRSPLVARHRLDISTVTALLVAYCLGRSVLWLQTHPAQLVRCEPRHLRAGENHRQLLVSALALHDSAQADGEADASLGRLRGEFPDHG